MSSKQTDKLLAEWFWTDRWMGSSAFALPIAARGLYREMLTQAWRRGAELPSDPSQIRRMVGVSLVEWRTHWPKVRKYWIKKGSRLINLTQIQIYADAKLRSEKATIRARKAANARYKQHGSAAQAQLEECPPSPSPSPVRTKNPPTPLKRGVRLTRRDLAEAKEIRQRSHGGCPHQPRCASHDDCVREIAIERKAKAS